MVETDVRNVERCWAGSVGGMELSACQVAAVEKRRKWKWFGIGLAVRLAGLVLIWVGDGSESLFRKAVVVLGVILSIGGIGVLKYLLISGFRKKK